MKVVRLTVDGVIVEEGKILLIERGNEPYKGLWALPGGFVEYGETTEKAVVREVKEETGLLCNIKKLVGVYSDPERDPRGHTVSIVYMLTGGTGDISAGDDAVKARWFPVDKLPEVAFDHSIIIKDALS
ncbi:MAG: NUDIX hydrolase [Candidatus Methanofastidiosia archaeon]|jgi:8-oxo-dGTP diphosphatase